MSKRHLELVVGIMALLATLSPAHATLDPNSGVLAEELVNVTIQTLADLTTAPQRALSPLAVHPDARAIAPANPAHWTPIAGPVPGVLVRGTIKDDPQARFLIRLPNGWNGKLVVAGSSGTRSEFNGDLVISDFVLQKGYAYASQNKGMQNFVLTTAGNPRTCPLRPIADLPIGSPGQFLLDFSLLDQENTMQEWGRRMNQAALIAKSIIEEHYGTKPSRTYAMGVSNGGYQVRKGIEDYPQTFDGGVDWEGVFWRQEGPNFIGEIPVGLKQFPGYRAGASTGIPFDPNSPEAAAIEAANFPPDLVENATSLWTLNRFAFWEVTECLYVKEVDPGYNQEFPGFEAFADYDFTTRPESVPREITKFENSGVIRKPLLSVHGTLDALIPLKGHARPYQEKIEAQGFGQNYRLYEVQNGNHLEAFKGPLFGAQLPNLELIQPHAHRAFELLAWIIRER